MEFSSRKSSLFTFVVLILRFGIQHIVLDFSEEKRSQRFKMWPICLLGCPRSNLEIQSWANSSHLRTRAGGVAAVPVAPYCLVRETDSGERDRLQVWGELLTGHAIHMFSDSRMFPDQARKPPFTSMKKHLISGWKHSWWWQAQKAKLRGFRRTLLTV